MVTMTKSASYTVPALDSFFQHTPMREGDRFILLDNDADFDLPERFAAVELVRNDRPRGFADNVNQILTRAAPAGADIIFLNNDIIFTKGWLSPLLATDTAIVVPLCNQH